MSAYDINYVIAKDMLRELDGKRREVLISALRRNCILTSSWILEHGIMRVYKEGTYLKLCGTRCGFAVFAKDNDGELEILNRKPAESKLSFLYESWLHFDENFFSEFV